MTTMVISTMTFSWCDQVASSTLAATGQTSAQNGQSTTTNAQLPTAAPGGYEFHSTSVGRRSAATSDVVRNSIIGVPSTLVTIVLPSPSRENLFAPSGIPQCGGSNDRGTFIQNFDDLSYQDARSADNPGPMPMSAPYHRFYYSGGFTVLPPPAGRFKPASDNLMLQFTPSSISNVSQSGIPPDTADISVGPQKHTSCFSFNFTQVSLGCDSKDASCSFTFTGFKYDRFKTQTTVVATQIASVPPCLEATGCALTPIHVSNFNDITSITIKADVNGGPTIWWADDFAFGWFDSTCESEACRSRVPNGSTSPSWAAVSRQAASKLMTWIGVRD
ncbi:hypothetical protein F4777DRAFT_592069 [Nemania sp. FL0916]|nr:hypothetical protein F4777DRAFT_592069 [Nemania sp. FL0916]